MISGKNFCESGRLMLHKKEIARRERVKKNISREFPEAKFDSNDTYIFIILPFENVTIKLELLTYSRQSAICRLQSMSTIRGVPQNIVQEQFSRARGYAQTITTQIEGLAKNG